MGLIKDFAKLGLVLVLALFIIIFVDVVTYEPTLYLVHSTVHRRVYSIYRKVDGETKFSRTEYVDGDKRGGEPPKPSFELKEGEYIERTYDEFEIMASAKGETLDYYTYTTKNKEEFYGLKIGARVEIVPIDSIPNIAQGMTLHK